jgi:hypothetical protein
MLVGLLTTIYLIPNTTDTDDTPSTLETLAAENILVDNKMKDLSVDNLMVRMLKKWREKSEPLLRPIDERTTDEYKGSSKKPHPDVEQGSKQD